MVVLLVAAGAATADLLVRVDLAPGQDVKAVASSGVDVLVGFDGWCLARGEDTATTRLAGRFDCTVLDPDHGAECHVYAEPDLGFYRRRLAEFGSVLTEERTGALLQTTDDGIKGSRPPAQPPKPDIEPQSARRQLRVRAGLLASPTLRSLWASVVTPTSVLGSARAVLTRPGPELIIWAA